MNDEELIRIVCFISLRGLPEKSRQAIRRRDQQLFVVGQRRHVPNTGTMRFSPRASDRRAAGFPLSGVSVEAADRCAHHLLASTGAIYRWQIKITSNRQQIEVG